MSQFSGLRSQDRIVRDVLWHHPQTPRPVADRWYPARNGLYLFFVVCAFSFTGLFWFILTYVLHLIEMNVFWYNPRAIIAVTCGPFFIFFLWYSVIHPLYAWRTGLQLGRPAIAIIKFIEQRPAPNSVRGTWEVWIDGRQFITKFREYTLENETWIQSLREGDRINVLLHPTKDKVLLAYGP